MELQKIQKCQSNPEENEQYSRNNSSRLQTIHKATVIKSVTLAQEETYRSMEKNRKPGNKPTYIWSINLWQRRQEYTE